MAEKEATLKSSVKFEQRGRGGIKPLELLVDSQTECDDIRRIRLPINNVAEIEVYLVFRTGKIDLLVNKHNLHQIAKGTCR